MRENKSKKQKKTNKYGWDRRRIMVAIIAGAMALLLLVPILLEALSLAVS